MNPMQKYPHNIEICFFSCFMPNNFSNFFRNIFNSETVKINHSNIFTIQSNAMCTNICIFNNVYYICPILYFFRKIISRINSIESRFILIILCISKFVKGWGGIKKLCKSKTHNQLLIFIFLLYFHNLFLAFLFLLKCFLTN